MRRYFEEWHETLAQSFGRGGTLAESTCIDSSQTMQCTPGLFKRILQGSTQAANHADDQNNPGSGGSTSAGASTYEWRCFQNWAQYLITMKYLAGMTEKQTLHLRSSMGLFHIFQRLSR
jgi:hypothetical protein